MTGRRPLRATRAPIAVAVLVAAVLALAPAAGAHPLGNFSVNHLSTVRISDDEVRVRYVLDQAEIPTVQERDLTPAEVLARKRDEVRRGLELAVDGRRVPLAAAGAPRLTFPAGAAGLPTTRLELSLRAPVDAPRRVELRDGTFPGRVGWKAVVSAPGEGTAVRTSAPSGDPTGGLRRYPDDLLSSPLDRREATFSVRPGEGTLTAPETEGGPPTTTGAAPVTEGGAPEREGGAAAATEGGPPAAGSPSRGPARSDGFAGLFEDAASGEGVLLLLLLTAFGWGALHALSPGHGKAMVAAYLVGTRGTSRHAVALGATVTITHTIGVFALGVVTLALSQYVLSEDLYPWLTLVSGLLVVAVGAGVLRSRLRKARHMHAHPHSHAPADLGWKGLLGMGTAAGLIPCPSALVVLLAALSQHEVALGLLLIVAFSLGLAGTLTVLGLAVVHTRNVIPRRLATGRVARCLPAASAVLIVGVGCVLTARAVPGVV
jgi:nickel/cobalt transporter (NicO) family protein